MYYRPPTAPKKAGGSGGGMPPSENSHTKLCMQTIETLYNLLTTLETLS